MNRSITRFVIAGEQGAAGSDGADRREQLLGRVIFEHEPARTGPECFVDEFVEAEGRENQDPRGVVGGKDPAGGLEPIELWHADVSLSIQQREREIALLRAVAATPGQIRRMIACEAAIIALIGSAAGIWPGRGSRC